jgi:cell division protein FtsB
MFKSISGRSLAFATTLLILAITLAPPTQRYFAQRAQINSYKAQIAGANSTLRQAQDELLKWNDPAYVAQQARTRLHYVFPGERQYAVIGAGKQPGQDQAPAAPVANQIPIGIPWYAQVISSITATNVNK